MQRNLIVAAGALVVAACLFHVLDENGVASFAQSSAQAVPVSAIEPRQDTILVTPLVRFSSAEPGSTDVSVTQPSPEPASPAQDAPPAATTAEAPDAAPVVVEPVAPAASTLEAEPLQAHPGGLAIPVSGMAPNQLIDSFNDPRGANGIHEAIDIMATLQTPVVAVADGKVMKLFDSVPGGHTLYQFDASEKFAYYYAHLDGYAPGIVEGQKLKRGDLLGYVGVSGNANPLTPHLHFAVFALGPEKRWWQGHAINPFPLFQR